jgi:type I restriction enzyme S subunit
MLSQFEEIPSGFKMTELGPLPENWKVVTLDQVASLKDGDWILKRDYSEYGVRLLQIADIGLGTFSDKSDRYIPLQRAQELNCTFLKEGDILISRMGVPIGRACMMTKLEYPAITAVDVTIFRHNPTLIDNNYALYTINSPSTLSQAASLSYGVTRNRVTRRNLQRNRISLPPLPEQSAIARVLSTIQRAIEAQDKVIAAARELKKSLMRHLFTYGPVSISEVDNVTLKETEIGLIPEKWGIMKVGDIAEQLIGGGTPSTNNPEYWNGDIHWTTSKRIYGIYLDSGEKTISNKGLAESATHLIPKNNLIIGTRVGVGKVAIPKIDIAISQDLTGVFINSNKYVPEFLAYEILTDNIQGVFQERARGTTIKGITRDDLKKILLKIPPYAQQEEIAYVFLTVDKKIEAEENRKAALQTLFKTMLHLLMTGQLRVKDLEV